jgi:hypothetical protein
MNTPNLFDDDEPESPVAEPVSEPEPVVVDEPTPEPEPEPQPLARTDVCPRCGKRIPEPLTTCPHCGYYPGDPLEMPKEPPKSQMTPRTIPTFPLR